MPVITADQLFERVRLAAAVGEHRAGDQGVLVEFGDDGYGVVEFDSGRWLQIVAIDELEPATPARPTTPAA